MTQSHQPIAKKHWLTFWKEIIVALIALIGVLVGVMSGGCDSPNSTFDVAVQVEDSVTGEKLQQAQVSLVLTDIPPLVAVTGVDGYASIRVDSQYLDQRGELQVQKNGYALYERMIPVQKDDMPIVVPLEKEP